MRKIMVRCMKAGVDFLGRHRFLRAPFFWLTFYNLRLFCPVQYLLLRELLDCDSVLDLGCGQHSMVPILPSTTYTVGVELFEPHYREALAKGRHKKYMNADITEVDFEPGSFDAVVMLDVLEHLPKDKGAEIIKKMSLWARKKIVIFTPNGYFHQDEYAGNPLMRHQSGWECEELLALGFRAYGVRGLRRRYRQGELPECAAPKEPAPDSLGSGPGLAQIWTYYHPKSALQLFCVKTMGVSR